MDGWGVDRERGGRGEESGAVPRSHERAARALAQGSVNVLSVTLSFYILSSYSRKVASRRARARRSSSASAPGKRMAPAQLGPPKFPARSKGGAFVGARAARHTGDARPPACETRAGCWARAPLRSHAPARRDEGKNNVSLAVLTANNPRPFTFLYCSSSLTSVPQGLDRPDPAGEAGRAGPPPPPAPPPPPPPPPTAALTVRPSPAPLPPPSASLARRPAARAVRSARAASQSAVSASMAASSRSRRLEKRGRDAEGWERERA